MAIRQASLIQRRCESTYQPPDNKPKPVNMHVRLSILQAYQLYSYYAARVLQTPWSTSVQSTPDRDLHLPGLVLGMGQAGEH